jgi:hypothetical protein
MQKRPRGKKRIKQNAKVKIRKKFISFLFLAFASRRHLLFISQMQKRPRGLQIRIKTNAKVKIRTTAIAIVKSKGKNIC